MTEPPTRRRKMHPAVVVGCIALATWILLAVCMGENSLDRADKAASVIGMLLALGTFTGALVEQQRRSSAQGGEGSEPQVSFFRRPSVLTGLAVMAVGLLIVVAAGLLANGGQTDGSKAQDDRTTQDHSPSASAPPSASASPSASSPVGSAEPCASTAGIAPTSSGTGVVDAVRHEGALVISQGYYADLDSLCPDWNVTDVLGTKQDVGNNGKAFVRSLNAGAQIAVVEGSAAATFSMCSANTDYVPDGAIPFKELKVGARYCVLTDAGRRSLLTVKRLRRDGGRTTVHLDVRTWAEKRPSEETNYWPWVIAGAIILMLVSGGAKSAAGKNDDEEVAGSGRA
ncbi:hypothetical protein ACGFH8_32585 [Micromonospora sp. NPDC049175]|uniref:hypothetical protein n=1 Tax=Micromonospora sp. NPDC049175 TaxID=3364266 RepID=UPI003717A401